jgi:hypothetical protein
LLLDYFYSDNQFVNLGFNRIVGVNFMLKADREIGLKTEIFSSDFISISNNHRLNRLSFGYGFSLVNNFWNITYMDGTDSNYSDEINYSSIGLYFPVNFYLNEHFRFGVSYRPTFYRPYQTEKYKYEYLLKFAIIWDVRLTN